MTLQHFFKKQCNISADTGCKQLNGLCISRIGDTEEDMDAVLFTLIGFEMPAIKMDWQITAVAIAWIAIILFSRFCIHIRSISFSSPQGTICR